MKGALGAYQIAANETRVGLMTFGAKSSSNLQLSDGVHKSVVVQKIFDATPVGGDMKLNEAVLFANANMFKDEKAKDSGKILVFVISGSSDRIFPDGVTNNALNELKKKNVTVLVVAVGKKASHEELKRLAENDKLIRVEEINDIKEALTKVVEESSKVKGKLKRGFFVCS